MFFDPATNNILYFEFFSQNEFLFFSNTFLKGLVEYPYDLHVFDMISFERTGHMEVNPNTGVLGTGYMQLGFAGLFLYAVLVGLLAALIEGFSKNLRPVIPVAVAGPTFFLMLTSTDLSTALLTGGLALAILLLMLLPAGNRSGLRI